jgi:hypothetical protein
MADKDDEARQELLAQLARRTPEEERRGYYDQRALAQRGAASLWCRRPILISVIAIALVVWLVDFLRTEFAPTVSAGLVPIRYQGAYNGYACGWRNASTLVQVSEDTINYGPARFIVESVVAQTGDSITLRGYGFSTAGRESERTLTISYAEVGGTARIGEGSYERCSQW